jgi:hypothetical protein
MKWWEYLDFTSVEAKLYHKAKQRYVTSFGIIISILSFLSLGALSILFVTYYFQKTDINVLYYNENKEFISYMDLNKKPFFYRLRNLDGSNFDGSIATVVPQYWFSENGVFSSVTLETEKCMYGIHFSKEKYSSLLKNIELSKFNCFNSSKYNLNLTSDPFETKLTYFNLYLVPCVNSTINNHSCQSSEKISALLLSSNFYFEYYFPSFSIDHNNITNPIQESLFLTVKKIHPDVYTTYKELIKVVNYTIDDGLMIQSLQTTTFFGKDPLSYVEVALIRNNKMNSFATFQITINQNSIEKYTRTSPKIQSLFANLGGIIKFIWSISSFIAQYVSSQLLEVELSNHLIFNDDESKVIKPESNIILNQGNLINKSFMVPVDNNSRTVLNKIIKNNFNLTALQTIKKKRNLNFKEILLPKFCLNKSSYKHELGEISEIIKSKLSSNELLKLFKDFENLKYLLLDEYQLILFDRMKSLTLKEHKQKLNSFEVKLNPIHFECFDCDISNIINKRLLSKLH